MKKVLFITYYWPPSGKASIHWPLNIIKYLPEFGWQPSVLTVKEDTFSSKDTSLLDEMDKKLEVVKTRSFEPFNLYKKFTGKGKEDQLIASETISRTNKKLTHRISIWIRMNLFIPDARIGWYIPGIIGGSKYLKKGNVDAIISVGPPHSTHLIGMKLGKRFKIPHIPVFIDPWVDIIYYKNFKRSKLTLKIDNHFERKVLQRSKSVVFVNRTMEDGYINKYPFIKNKSHVLYWGYNEEDFVNLIIKNPVEKEVLVHAGNIFDFQNTPEFWNRVKKEIDNGRNLRIKFIGTVGPKIKQAIELNHLTELTDYLGFLPYKEMIEQLTKASYLMVCATEPRHVPGKLYEYLRTGKPIIAFGDDNREVRKILENTNSGMIFNYDQDGAKFFENLNQFKTDLSKVKNFDRKHIAKALAEILKG